jgi:hypothetical protein
MMAGAGRVGPTFGRGMRPPVEGGMLLCIDFRVPHEQEIH